MYKRINTHPSDTVIILPEVFPHDIAYPSQVVVFCRPLLHLPHSYEGCDGKHGTQGEYNNPQNTKQASCYVCPIEIALESSVTFAAVHGFPLFTDGVVVDLLQLYEVESDGRNKPQTYEHIQQGFSQQQRRETVGHAKHAEGQRGTSVKHQRPAARHAVDVRGQFELVELVVQLLDLLRLRSGECVGSSVIVLVQTA